MIKGSEARKADYHTSNIFLDRWSSRAMSGKSITKEELMILFEAARWAPSDSNEQPWRFVYALRGTGGFDKLFSLLVEFNKLWCENASALVCLLAKKTNKEGKPNRNAFSDAGAAWQNLALQGSLMDLVVHGMAGFDVNLARELLKVPDDYEIVHMIAIGKPANKSVLHERMQKSEAPNSRMPITDFVFESTFGNK